MQISKNTVATLEYTLSNTHGKVMDTSRNHGPMVYLHGVGAILAGLESALEGKAAGDAIKITLPPEQAYGPKNPDRVISVPRKDFTGVEEIAVGMQFRAGGHQGAQIVTIISVSDETVTVDANHPLAGATVMVEANVLDVREATAEEIDHGHVCYGAGNCAEGEGCQHNHGCCEE